MQTDESRFENWEIRSKDEGICPSEDLSDCLEWSLREYRAIWQALQGDDGETK